MPILQQPELQKLYQIVAEAYNTPGSRTLLRSTLASDVQNDIAVEPPVGPLPQAISDLWKLNGMDPSGRSWFRPTGRRLSRPRSPGPLRQEGAP